MHASTALANVVPVPPRNAWFTMKRPVVHGARRALRLRVGAQRVPASSGAARLDRNADHRLAVEWSAEPAGARTTGIAAYVTNHYGGQIDHMRLLAQPIDHRARSSASAAVVGLRRVNAFGRTDFEIGDLRRMQRITV
jgi:hypothetical protein